MIFYTILKYSNKSKIDYASLLLSLYHGIMVSWYHGKAIARNHRLLRQFFSFASASATRNFFTKKSLEPTLLVINGKAVIVD